MPRSVGAVAEALIGARGDTRRLREILEQGPVPMVIVDCDRRYGDVNRPARLWFRRSEDEMRANAMDDFAPADRLAVIAQDWERLLRTGCLAGSYLADRPDGSRVETVYFALANVLPGRHAIVFAPADWPEDDLDGMEDDRTDPFPSLTPREREVLTLAADGLNGPELARRLVLSPATINTHFNNIYDKLGVRNRTAAVAKALRLGTIC